MHITAANFTRAVVVAAAVSAMPVQSKPLRRQENRSQPAVEARGVSGVFDLPINHIILGFLFASTMFSVAGRLQGIASDWFDNTGPTGVSVIKEVQEPYESEYDDYDEGEPEGNTEGLNENVTTEPVDVAPVDSQVVSHGDSKEGSPK